MTRLDVLFRAHNYCSRSTNRKDVFRRQIVIGQFRAKMLRVDDGALVEASIEFGFVGIIPTPKLIARKGRETPNTPKPSPRQPVW